MSKKHPQGILESTRIREQTHMVVAPRMEGVVKNANMRSERKPKKKGA